MLRGIAFGNIIVFVKVKFRPFFDAVVKIVTLHKYGNQSGLWIEHFQINLPEYGQGGQVA
jgi:hypothetical protein